MTVLSSLACQVTAAGISRPNFSDIYETLQSKFKSIYGSDVYIDPDSQDGQMLATFAKAVDDCNAATQAVYASFSPATAQGIALSNNVKINGIARSIPTNSTVDIQLTGTAGVQIKGGIVSDTSGQRWHLPDVVTILPGGFATATATAENPGAVKALNGTVTKIETPQLGWISANNASAASPGAAVETDALLRQRQAVSVSLPSRSILEGIIGTLLGISGVTAVRGYENDTNATDANGIPAHAVALVVQGGDQATIANAILRKKGPGCYTHGTTSTSVYDTAGMGPYTIRFLRPALVRVLVGITIQAKVGYTTGVGDAIKASIAAYINGLGIGNRVDLGKVYLPAQFYGGQDSSKFEVNVLTLAVYGNALTAADINIGFSSLATCDPADITLTVT